MLDSPCYHCGERSTGCHAACARYQAFRAERDEQIESRLKTNAAVNAFTEAAQRRVTQARQKRRRGW